MEEVLKEIITTFSKLHISDLGEDVEKTMTLDNELSWNTTMDGIYYITAFLESFDEMFILLNEKELEDLDAKIPEKAKRIFKDQFELETSREILCKDFQRYERIFKVDPKFLDIKCTCKEQLCIYKTW